MPTTVPRSIEELRHVPVREMSRAEQHLVITNACKKLERELAANRPALERILLEPVALTSVVLSDADGNATLTTLEACFPDLDEAYQGAKMDLAEHGEILVGGGAAPVSRITLSFALGEGWTGSVA